MLFRSDTYYTIDDGRIVESVWDDVSAELHTEDKRYFNTPMEFFVDYFESTPHLNWTLKDAIREVVGMGLSDAETIAGIKLVLEGHDNKWDVFSSQTDES